MYYSPIPLSELLRSFAYLDPGSGSIILQLAIAAILGLGVLVRSQWARIKRLFGGKSAEIDEKDDDDTNDD